MGDLLPGMLNTFFDFPPKTVVTTRRIAEFFREIREHHLDNTRITGGRRMII
jgi:hypothetical protein